jgi:hypothetical protein
MIQQIQKHKSHKRQPSESAPQEFVNDCKVLAPDFEKNVGKVNRIYKKWLSKGRKPQVIGKWLRPILRQWYSASVVSEMLPKEARRSYNRTGLFSKNTGKVDAPEVRKTQNVPTGSTRGSQKETEKTDSIRIGPIKTHTTGLPDRFNQGADEYEIEELDQYDIDYLRTIVKWLHKLRMDFIQEAFKWQSKFDNMQREKKELMKTLAEHGIKT